MNGEAYRAFTEALVERLGRDPRVRGLVALGSMAGEPDEWSDHDFFVVTEPGVQEDLRADLSWLPEFGRVALAFRETAHGLKVVYEDGHLLEFAVFDLVELGVARVNRYRVLLDRGGLAERMAELPGGGPRDERYLFGQVVTLVLVGAGRMRRGERLSGGYLVELARRDLAALLGGGPDDLDPLRRFELAAPELAEELRAAGPLDLLVLAERELRPRRPDLAWAALEAVRRRLS